jgi:Phytanoyl-CoA dioxygenase (PhyH)
MVHPPAILANPRLDSQLAREGYAVADALDDGSLAALQAIFDRDAHLHHGGFSATLLLDDFMARERIDTAMTLILAPLVRRILVGYRSVYCGFAVKEPAGGRGAMPYHQDITLSPPEGRAGMSLWIPLVDVGTANGCLVVAAGSHRLPCPPRAPGSPFLAAGLEDELETEFARPLPLRAGQVVVMDHRTIHASGPNQSVRVRPAVAAIAIPSEAPLVYYHRDSGENSGILRVFEVPDDFLLRHRLGCAPGTGRAVAELPEAASPSITSATLRNFCLSPASPDRQDGPSPGTGRDQP